jgi:hypothetical protein
MDPSVIGKPSLRVGLLMGLLMGLSLLLLVACDDQNSAKGGANQEHKKSTSGGTASTNLQMGATGGSAATNGQIAFGRHQPAELFRDQTPSAIFAMNPDGSHVSQITHPPRAFATTDRSGPPMGRGSPSFARESTRKSTSLA